MERAAEMERVRSEGAAELRRLREEASAVRARARTLAEDRDVELTRLRAALKDRGGDVDDDGADSEDARSVAASASGLAPSASSAAWSREASIGSSLAEIQAEVATVVGGGEVSREAALMLSARMQAGRDAESTALRGRLATAEATLAQREAEATRYAAEAAELRRQLERGKAAEAPGFLKDVVFKYLVASEEQQQTIFALLASILQFTPQELSHIRRVREHVESTSTASGILSSFFLSPAPPEQDAFADPAAVVDDTAAAEPAYSSSALDFDLYAGGRAAAAGPPLSLQAAPLLSPFAPPPAPAAPAADAEALAEARRKVARLKKLLVAANGHIELFKGQLATAEEGLAARDAAIQRLEAGSAAGAAK